MYEYPFASAEILSITKGRPSEVEFDWEAVRSFRKKTPDFDPSRLHFWHVHPPNCLFYSALDMNCLEGFNVALNYPVRFSIIVFKTPSLVTSTFDIDVDYSSLHLTMENKVMIRHSDEDDDWTLRLPRSVLASLKALSFGDNWQVCGGEG